MVLDLVSAEQSYYIEVRENRSSRIAVGDIGGLEGRKRMGKELRPFEGMGRCVAKRSSWVEVGSRALGFGEVRKCRMVRMGRESVIVEEEGCKAGSCSCVVVGSSAVVDDFLHHHLRNNHYLTC